jgi:hypothetical protein
MRSDFQAKPAPERNNDRLLMRSPACQRPLNQGTNGEIRFAGHLVIQRAELMQDQCERYGV